MAKRILVAEDDNSSLMLLRMMLEAEGEFEVVSGADGEEAWELLMGGTPFDACILDVMMPRLDGLELTKRIRSHPALARIPIILCTVQGDRSTVGQAAALAIKDFIVKPYTKARILKQVRGVCGSQASSGNLEPFEQSSRRLGITEKQLVGFLQDFVRDAAPFAASLNEGASDEAAKANLVRIGALKGAASNFGAVGVVRTLTALEESLRSGTPAAGSDLVRDFSSELGRLSSVLPGANPAPVLAAS